MWGLGPSAEGDLAAFVATELGIDGSDVAAFDLMFHDLTPPARLGADGELIAAARLGQPVLVLGRHRGAWPAVTDEGPVIPVVCLFDHEEVGSASTTGAAGPLLEIVIDRLVRTRGGTAEDRHRALVRLDLRLGRHGPRRPPQLPRAPRAGPPPAPQPGPVLKVNANQRYATDATTEVAFTRACEQAGVPWQVFVSRNNMPCGSTIGPITATRLGIATVDVGCAQLSMHSARELAGALDPAYLAAALRAFVMPDIASHL